MQTTLRRGEQPIPKRGWSLRSLGIGKAPSICTYVGADGWSRHWLRSRDRKDIGSEVFRFDQAVALHAGEITTNTLRPGKWETVHLRTWRDAEGKPAAKIKGTWKGQGDKPEASDPWWFAVSAEASWNLHWLDAHRHELLGGGPIEFPMRRGRRIRIGKGFMEVDWNNQISCIPLDQIVMLNLLGGRFHLEVADKSLFKKGELRLHNSEIPNLQGFLYAVTRVLGYPLDRMGSADAGEGTGASSQ